MKALLIIYILANFIDDIPGIAQNLMGGTTLPTYKMNALSMGGKALSVLAAIQKRGAGASMKWGGKAAGKAGGAAASAARAAGTAASAVKRPGGSGDGGGSISA